MRFSGASLLLALPAVAVAAEDTPDYVAQFQGQFQNFLGKAQGFFGKVGEQVPSPSDVPSDPIEAVEAKVGELTIHSLTLENWNETLFAPVQPDSVEPENWWVLITSGNKTCLNGCQPQETAFNASAAKFGVLPNAPHVGMINCDNEPILCNAWSAPSGYIYVLEMLPRPAPINIYTKRLNGTTVTTETVDELYQEGHRSFGRLHDGYFHPYDGPLAEKGILVPAAYTIWAFNLVPSWAVMLVISMFSRLMMSNRAQPTPRGAARPQAAAPAAQ